LTMVLVRSRFSEPRFLLVFHSSPIQFADPLSRTDIPLLTCLKPLLKTSSGTTTITEASAVQALRKYGTGLLEIRMQIVEPNQRSYRSPEGGYQFRRTDWASSSSSSTTEVMMTKSKWDAQTVYIVRYPLFQSFNNSF